MIRLFYALPRTGKTSVCAAMGLDRMHGAFARHCVRNAAREVAELNANGFSVSMPPTDHLVFTYKFEIDARSPDFGHRTSYEAHPEDFGFAVDGFGPWFVYDCSTLIFDEFQTIYDSRNWQQFPENVSRAYEQHGKKLIDIWIIAQDPSLVEKRIRQLCQITLVKSMQLQYNSWGERVSATWLLHNWNTYESWLHGETPEEETYTFKGDVYKIYNTYAGKEMFYAGLKDKDFKVNRHATVDLSPEGIERYAQEHKIQLKKPATQNKGANLNDKINR